MTKSGKERSVQLLENEVATWNDYIMGENYAYDLVNEKTGEIIDGGFWTGDIESLKAFAFNSAPTLYSFIIHRLLQGDWNRGYRLSKKNPTKT